MEKAKLQIGCGKKPMAGYVNLDVIKYPWVDVVHDLDRFPWPFRDSQFEEVYANSVLEHLDDLLRSMGEIHRILRPGGVLRGGVPWYNYAGAFGDPTHKHFFNLSTFQYFTGKGHYSYTEKTGIWRIVKLEVTPTRYGSLVPFKKKLLPFLGGFVGNLAHKINFELEAVK